MASELAKSSKVFRGFLCTTVVAACLFLSGMLSGSQAYATCRLGPWTPQVTTESPDSLTQLRADVDAWISQGMGSDDFEELAGRTMELAKHESDPSELLSILHESSRLCWHGPAEQTRALRTDSLHQLLEMPEESGRARTMMRSQFLPALHRIVPEKQFEEVEVFDQLVDKLITADLPQEFRADLGYAKSLLRVEVNRAWNAGWLNQAERDRIIECAA